MTTLRRLRATLLAASAAAREAVEEAESQKRQIASRLRLIRDGLGEMVQSLERGESFEEILASQRHV